MFIRATLNPRACTIPMQTPFSNGLCTSQTYPTFCIPYHIHHANNIPISAQSTNGISNVLTLFKTSRPYHLSSSKCPARKKPEATKNHGTAILQNPSPPKRLTAHHCHEFNGGRGVQWIATIIHTQMKLITAIRRDVSLHTLIGFNSILLNGPKEAQKGQPLM